MLKQMLGGKIHRVTVTEACIDYPGSITIDRKLMDKAGILPHEKVLIANLIMALASKAMLSRGLRDPA